MSQAYFNLDDANDSEYLMSWLLFDFDSTFQNNADFQPQASGGAGINDVVAPNNEIYMQNGMLPDAMMGNDPFHGTSSSNHYQPPQPPSMMTNNPTFDQYQQNNNKIDPNNSASNLYHRLNGVSSRRSSSNLRAAAGNGSMNNNTKDNNTSSSNSNSKKRPRESVEDLEVRVKELQAENADLHAHLLNVTQRTTEVQRQRAEMERLMIAKVATFEESEQNELKEIVKKYTDIYADYGKCRQREVSFHLQQIEKLIIPTKTTKMCLWTLQQDKSFYQKNKSPMYDILSKELELSSEQTLKFQEQREKTQDLLAKLKECLDLLKLLKSAIEKKHACYDNICGRAQSAATPRQTVKFLIWINRNADLLARYIPGFTRNQHHTPNVEFVQNSQLSRTVAAALENDSPPTHRDGTNNGRGGGGGGGGEDHSREGVAEDTILGEIAGSQGAAPISIKSEYKKQPL